MSRLDQLGQGAHLPAMKQVNLYDAKTALSSLVEEAAGGEEIVIAKNGKPKAKLVSLATTSPAPKRKPEFGFWNHFGWSPPDNFDDPDPEIEALFYGDDEGS
jgi:prevent-host-death family protein